MKANSRRRFIQNRVECKLVKSFLILTQFHPFQNDAFSMASC